MTELSAAASRTRTSSGGPDDPIAAEPIAEARLAGDEELDRSLRPRALDDFVNQEQVTEPARGLHRGRASGREESLDHVLLAGPPGLGKTSLAHIIAAELGAPLRADRRAGARAQGRHRRLPHRARARVGVLHRRDPPAQPGDRGDALPGDGGPPAADRPRPGRRRAHRDARPAAVHAGRRDHPRGAAHHAASRSLRRLASASSTTSADHLAEIVRRSARILEVEIEPGGERVIAERSRGTPRVANRLLKRVRDYAQVRGEGVITADVAAEALEPARGRRRAASTATTARSSRRSRSSSPAARSASRPSRPRSTRSRRRSRTSTSPTCSSRAC